MSVAAPSSGTVHVRQLTADDAAAFQALRLEGLRAAPEAFASSFEEEAATPLATVAERLALPTGPVFGAFAGGDLVGIVGLQREQATKLAHKAFVWGLYAAPRVRRQGIAHHLLAQALAHARQAMAVRQVHLGVNVANHAALALYRRHGFIEYGRVRDFLVVDGTFHDEYLMVCDLGARAEHACVAEPTPSPLEVLTRLERQLHRPDVRSDPRALGERLHPAFREFGCSGRTYTRDDVLAEFAAAPPAYAVVSQDYAVEALGPDLALLTYRTAHVAAGGGLERHVWRSSLWQRTAAGWQLRFHQGTLAPGFAPPPH